MKNNVILCLSLLLLCLASCKKEDDNNSPAPEGPSVAELLCDSAIVSPLLILPGKEYAGVLTIPYTVGNGFPYDSGTVVTSTGVAGLTASLRADTLNRGGSGRLVFDLTGTPATEGVASFEIDFGGYVCVINLIVGEKSLIVGKWICINTVDSLTFISSTHANPDTTRREFESYSFLPPGSAYYNFTVDDQFTFTNNSNTAQNAQGSYTYSNYLLTLNRQGGNSVSYPVMYIDSSRMKLSIATGIVLKDTLDVDATIDSVETYSIKRSMNLDKKR